MDRIPLSRSVATRRQSYLPWPKGCPAPAFQFLSGNGGRGTSVSCTLPGVVGRWSKRRILPFFPPRRDMEFPAKKTRKSLNSSSRNESNSWFSLFFPSPYLKGGRPATMPATEHPGVRQVSPLVYTALPRQWVTVLRLPCPPSFACGQMPH